MGRYNLKLSQEVPNAGGYRNTLRLGMPIAADQVNDICICAKGSWEFIALNRNILRDALLSSPDFCKNVLGLEVKEFKPETKKQTKKEEEEKQ